MDNLDHAILEIQLDVGGNRVVIKAARNKISYGAFRYVRRFATIDILLRGTAATKPWP